MGVSRVPRVFATRATRTVGGSRPTSCAPSLGMRDGALRGSRRGRRALTPAFVSDNSIADRIVLGTVQLGMPYGKRRRAGLMPRTLAEEILDVAWSLGVRVFDT